jgi:double-stranded uracil-DNA glycosylase
VLAAGHDGVVTDRATLAVYEAEAARWAASRRPRDLARTRAFAEQARAAALGPVADLGCGPGWDTAELPQPAVALDAAQAMVALVQERAPLALRVRGDLCDLPFRRGALGGAWASKSYVHLPRSALPMALWDLHRALAVGAPAEVRVFEGDLEHGPFDGDDFPGRSFSLWDPDHLRDVLVGAGFEVDALEVVPQRHGRDLVVSARRVRTLADTVAPDLRVLVCGINPSLHAADVGVGYAGPGNRFWPAAVAAGLVDVARDPRRALRDHGVGMTDLVKRATPRAADLDPEEHRAGLARLERLCAWLRPGVLVVVGLVGWRAAVDRRAVPGLQERDLGGTPVYVMPSTSGLNAATSIRDLVEHLRAAVALAGCPLADTPVSDVR